MTPMRPHPAEQYAKTQGRRNLADLPFTETVWGPCGDRPQRNFIFGVFSPSLCKISVTAVANRCLEGHWVPGGMTSFMSKGGDKSGGKRDELVCRVTCTYGNAQTRLAARNSRIAYRRHEKAPLLQSLRDRNGPALVAYDNREYGRLSATHGGQPLRSVRKHRDIRAQPLDK